MDKQLEIKYIQALALLQDSCRNLRAVGRDLAQTRREYSLPTHREQREYFELQQKQQRLKEKEEREIRTELQKALKRLY